MTIDPKLFHENLGPLLIGGLVSAMLYGISCLQTYNYFWRGAGDGKYLKTFVAALWCIDTFEVFLNGHVMYWYFVTNFVNPLALLVPVWSIVLHVSVTAISNFLVRIMFTWRVWRMSNGNWLLSGIIFCVSTTDFACSLAITVKAWSTTFIGLESLSTLFYIDFAAILVADSLIALSLCYFLHRSRTGIKKTDSLITVLIMYTINTGLLTAIDAIAGLVLYAIMPDNLIYVAFYLQLSKLYLNAYLATLNAREGLRGRTDEVVSIHLSELANSRGTYPTQSGRSAISTMPATPVDSKAEPLSIMVSTEVETNLDTDRIPHKNRYSAGGDL